MAGYDDARRAFLVRNSWGAGWGLGGYFWMPYAYATDPGLSSDFWVVRTVP
jgi:C1A family cysteine protease